MRSLLWLGVVCCVIGCSGNGGTTGTTSICTEQNLALVVEGQVTNRSAETFLIDIRKASAGSVQAGGDGLINEILSYRGGDDDISFRFESLFIYVSSLSDVAGTYAVKDYGDNGGSSFPPFGLQPGEAAIPGVSHPFRPSEAEFDIGPARGGTVRIQSFDTTSKMIHITFDLEYPLDGHLTGCLLMPVVGDTAPTPDAGLPDAALPPADAAVPTGPYYHYVGDTLLVPTDNTTATMYGLDLDETEPLRVDNAFGNVLGVFAMQGSDVQQRVDDAIAAGAALLLHSVQADNLANDPNVGWRVLVANPTATPPLFDGTDALTVDPASGSPSSTLPGAITGGLFGGGPALAPVTIRLAPFGSAPIDLHLVGLKIEATISSTGCDGKLGGGVTQADLDTTVIPSMAANFNAVVMNDPGCPSACGSSAQSVLDLFDRGISCTAATEATVCPLAASTCDVGGTDKCTCGLPDCGGNLAGDGEITAAEVKNNSLIKSLLTLDVDLLDASGAFQPDPALRDGLNDALSLGVWFTCVPASFTVAGEPP